MQLQPGCCSPRFKQRIHCDIQLLLLCQVHHFTMHLHASPGSKAVSPLMYPLIESLAPNYK